MINFDALPNSFDGGFKLLDPGWYTCTIKSAEMRAPKSGNGPDYLNIQLETGHGNVFDIFTESDKPLSQFKLKKFIEALGLKLHGNFELRDLTKVIVGKQVQANINIQKNPGYSDRNVVNAFENGGYKPVEEVPFDLTDEDSPFGNGVETY